MVDVDERCGVLDAVLHQVDEVGAAAEELRSAGGDGVDGFVGSGGALVGEGIHADAPFASGANGGDDVGVGAAAADVAGHALADLVVGELGVGGVAGFEGDDAESVAALCFFERGRWRSRSGRGCSSRTGSRRARGRRPARG